MGGVRHIRLKQVGRPTFEVVLQSAQTVVDDSEA